ncbi:MAG: AglZ/HisF2 family acetamidino modification protein [Hyphomicrobium sp.]|nr:AglZ/HisF2 family acetamidino modification protein [Hyphomicrobium sp.]
MLIPRVIPCLLINDGGMVKTRKFRKKTYLGDPVNVINLFNNFEVDEIVLLDIAASEAGRAPDIELVATVAEECWVPLTYGGGISRLDQIESLIKAGCEKVVLASAVADDLMLMREASREFGAQAIIGSVDARRKMFGGYETRVTNAGRRLGVSPVERARQFEDAGAGEILLQSIDRDGEMNGYDLELVAEVSRGISLPVVACGGAGDRDDLPLPVKRSGASASAAGSLFVFSGRERGVLINFPERDALEALFAGST